MFQNVDRENHRTATAVTLTPQAQERTVREALEHADALPNTLASARLLRILG
ncbi:MAG: hypothetical protein OEM15_10225 [Myxococcales bacterium]|nr:hypothetical protein [Myxococcales bacterium]MDH3486167.1 hypothetical protein [Myxococcales bacterium]